MAKVSWTPAQKNAIDARGGTLLLSAAAGSGKTAVLVERVIGLLTDPEAPVEVSSLLVVTFSNAAATEMRQRIGLRLAVMIAENPSNTYLQKQQALLGSASISTVHSFCLELIRENFQNLSISPDFALLDESELDLLKDDCASECIEEFYASAEHGQLFYELVELLASGRDDRRVKDTMFRIYGFARSHPFYEDWLDAKLALYDPEIPPGDTLWGKSILRQAQESMEYVCSIMEQAVERIVEDEKLEKAYLPAFLADIRQTKAIVSAIKARDWDAVVQGVKGFSFERLGSVRGECAYKEQAKETRERLKKTVADLAQRYLGASEAEFKEDILDLKPKIALLFAVVKRYGEILDKEKSIRRKLDFSDLEHLALELLVTKVGDTYRLTEEAKDIAYRYRYILVDEYQDTNEVQDLLFTSVSRGGENLFMVGDVKQSIYSFRMAMPEIFIRKRREYHPYDGHHFPAKILLDSNFRSRKEVTGGINYLFKQIMSREMGEIDYNEEETLKPGATFPAYSGAYPEFLLLNGEDYTGTLEYTELEAREIARKIQRMILEEYLVHDKGALRPAMPRDFCILLRAPKSRAEAYIKALSQLDVPAWAENTDGFLQAREVAVVVSLLRVLDNPLLDIALASALLSPMFTFTNDDIAAIRLPCRRAPLFLALEQSAEEGNEKTQHFLALFQKLRYYAASHSTNQLIMEIYRTTKLPEMVQAMPLGQSRYANLLLLVEYGGYYHKMGYKGLAGFVGLLERLEEKGKDLAPANKVGDVANVVRVMSIHRSKGLEFPIVILADSAKQFNLMDLRQQTLLHSEYGFASVRRNPETLAQFPTIPMGAIRIETQKTMLSEEMRILYVALTRAEEKLIVVSTLRRNATRIVSGLTHGLKAGKVPSYLVSEAGSYSDWMIMALLHHPGGEALRALSGVENIELLADDTPWSIQVITPEDQEEVSAVPTLVHNAPVDEGLLLQLQTAVEYQYPHIEQTLLPTKIAVSELALGQKNTEYQFSRRPRFRTRGGLTPAERGTALHNFMQFTRYEQARDALETEIERMETEEYLTPIEIESLPRDKIQTFFSSGLAQRMFASEALYRELRFMAECGKEELSQRFVILQEDSKIVVQGIADCVFIENGKAIIVDYKTDRVQSLEDLADHYRPQLALYKTILAKAMDYPVSETILYSFWLSGWVDTTDGTINR